ncbi:MAG TPA: hypothetical protein VGR57_19830 [Ktedonobacterales bacterium]|nr:hypothetical protein [Ktedonobacterales bacterium]
MPANATVAQAWLAIALRPSRRNIAAWARASSRSWVVTSLVVATAWAMVINGYAYVIRGLIWPPAPAKAEHYLFGAPSPLGRILYALDLVPIESFVATIAVAYAVSRVMPPSDETAMARFQRVLVPYALAQVSGIGAAIIQEILANIPEPVLQAHTLQPVTLVKGSATLALLAYSIALHLNALAAGSGMNRWKLLLLLVAVGAVVIGALLYLPALPALPFGVHFPLAT